MSFLDQACRRRTAFKVLGFNSIVYVSNTRLYFHPRRGIVLLIVLCQTLGIFHLRSLATLTTLERLILVVESSTQSQFHHRRHPKTKAEKERNKQLYAQAHNTMSASISRTIQSGRVALHFSSYHQRWSPSTRISSMICSADVVATRMNSPSEITCDQWKAPMGRSDRQFSSSAAGDSSDSQHYVSPFQEIFERMQVNGPTALGTTQEIIDMEKAYAKNQKKLQCGIPENVLRFSSTAYGRTLLAPYVHPNEHRVIMKMNTKHLPFSTANEYEILREIVGQRLNDDRKELRLTSNKFGSRIENKRHLVSMLDRIILSCQKLGAEIKDESETA